MTRVMRAPDYAHERRFRADVCIIGTGAGGAVVGAHLAEAGFSVILIEEGRHATTGDYRTELLPSVTALYRDAATTIALGRPPLAYLEGRCVGGTTVINGGMTYRAPEAVLARWSAQCGDASLSPAAMDPIFSRVERAVSASPQRDVSVGKANRLMVAGAAAMGWRFTNNLRNQRDCVGSNHCTFGCPTGAKQSTATTFVPQALANGARLLTEVRATSLKVVRGRCVGVRARVRDPWTQRLTERIEIDADAVVVACGAVQTPTLLQKLPRRQRSPHLGRHLYLHPNIKVIGLFPFDVKAWQGVNQYGQIKEFEDDGIVIADNFAHPGVIASRLPLVGSDLLRVMSRYNQMLMAGALLEDTSSGRVRRGMGGSAFVTYQLTKRDHERALRATRLVGEMLFEVGADQLLLPFSNGLVANCMDELRRVIAAQTQIETLEAVSVHLMGTARLGRSREESVVDHNGQLWELPGCYVADASLFPGPIGVNPQITVMALALRVAERLALRLRPGLSAPRPQDGERAYGAVTDGTDCTNGRWSV